MVHRLTRRRALGAAAATATACAASLFGVGSAAWARQFGFFEGDFVGRFIGGGAAITTEPLVFVDPGGLRWTAPAGVEVNGASIPRALWSIVGSPFAGDYLRAAVVHDHYCTTMERPWPETHRAFYNGCRADGLSQTFAGLLYAGVMRFGPRWSVASGLVAGGGVRRREPRFDQAEFDALRAWVEAGPRSLDEIDARISR